MLLDILSTLSCGLWVYSLIYLYRAVASMPVLGDEARFEETAEWPTLSVIIPACNEAEHLEAALESLLAEGYPRLELIVIDDRSTDGTGEIVDRLAASDSRVRAIHIEALPDGWLGKVHALHRGVREARGDWYLFTDADVYFRQGTLRSAVSYAKRHGLNHLTCVPDISVSSGFWLDVAIRAFFLLFAVSARLAHVNRENSRRPIGIGAFNLIEAAAFKRAPGFEWLRMEPADDVGIGVMLKEAGARTQIVNATEEMSVPWYENVGAMIRGLEKNSFGAGAAYSYTKQLLIVALLICLAIFPYLSFFLGIALNDAIILTAGGIALAVTLAMAIFMPRKSSRDIAANLLLPFGVFLMAVIMLRSAYKCLRNGGIDWRGTHYSVTELRRGQRVRF